MPTAALAPFVLSKPAILIGAAPTDLAGIGRRSGPYLRRMAGYIRRWQVIFNRARSLVIWTQLALSIGLTQR